MAYRKYEKTFRILTPNFYVPGKFTLSKDDRKQLLTGALEITEKVDGANTGIIRGKGDKWILQKRRGLADEGVHAQFSFFWNWARHNYEKILSIPSKWIVYGELCYATHHIYYDKLPSYFLVFDIWNGKEYLDSETRTDFCGKIKLCQVPILYNGYVKDLLELEKFVGQSRISNSALMEGLVVKNNRKQMRGKLVRPEFMKELEDEDHWLHKALKKNVLMKTANVYD